MSIYIKMTVSFIYYIIIHYWSNDCSGHWSTVNSLSCSWKVWFRWFQFHDIMCATRRWAHWSLWDKYGQCTRLVQLLLRGPKKISHRTSSWSINKKTVWIHTFMLFTTTCDPSKCHNRKWRLKPGNIFPNFYCPIMVSTCKLQAQFFVLSWQELHSV